MQGNRYAGEARVLTVERNSGALPRLHTLVFGLSRVKCSCASRVQRKHLQEKGRSESATDTCSILINIQRPFHRCRQGCLDFVSRCSKTHRSRANRTVQRGLHQVNSHRSRPGPPVGCRIAQRPSRLHAGPGKDHLALPIVHPTAGDSNRRHSSPMMNETPYPDIIALPQRQDQQGFISLGICPGMWSYCIRTSRPSHSATWEVGSGQHRFPVILRGIVEQRCCR